MAKPNKFIMNTDYMSIAQSGKYTHTYIRNGGTVPAYGQIIEYTDFTIPSQKGAIDRIFMSFNDGSFNLGTVCYSSEYASLSVYRVSPNTLRAEFVVNNIFNPDPVTFPLQKFVIKGIMFKPPNVF